MRVDARQALLDPARLDEMARPIARDRVAVPAPRSISRRHRLSRGGRRRWHDGLADPVELSRFRLGRGRARHGHRAQQSRLLLCHDRPPEPRRPAQAPAQHHHPRLHHQGRRAGRGFRRHGRNDAAAGPHADDVPHARLEPEPAGRDRCAALACRGRRRLGRGCAVARSARPDLQRAGIGFGAARCSISARRRSSVRVDNGYIAASEGRRDGAAVGF